MVTARLEVYARHDGEFTQCTRIVLYREGDTHVEPSIGNRNGVGEGDRILHTILAGRNVRIAPFQGLKGWRFVHLCLVPLVRQGWRCPNVEIA